MDQSSEYQNTDGNDPTFHNQLGLTYFAIGEYDKAIAEYKQAICIDPNYIDAHYNLAVVYGKGGESRNSAEGIRELHIVISIDPVYRVAPLLLADIYWDAKNCEEAEKWYAKALEIENADPWELFALYDHREVQYRARVHHQLGVMTERLHRDEDAIFHFSEAIRIDSSYLLPRYGLGKAYLRQKRFEAAISQFAIILELDSGFKDTQFLMGESLLAKKEYAQAIRYFERELYNDPRNNIALLRMANCHGMLRAWEDAIKIYRRLISIEPDNVEAHINIGVCYWNQNDFENSIDSFKKAVELDPENTAAQMYLIAAYEKTGDNIQAKLVREKFMNIENFDEILNEIKIAQENRKAANPYHSDWEEKKRREYRDKVIAQRNNLSNVDILLEKSRLFYSAGKWIESIKPCEAALMIDPNCALAHNFIGNALGKQGMWDEAERSYARALEIDPAMTMVRFNRAGIFMRWKQIDRALREYEEIIKQDPDFLPAHSNIAHISLEKGDVERAARAWKEMLRLEPNDVITRQNLMLYETYNK